MLSLVHRSVIVPVAIIGVVAAIWYCFAAFHSKVIACCGDAAPVTEPAPASQPSAQLAHDVIVGSIHDRTDYGTETDDKSGKRFAVFAIGTTSCNRGTAELNWDPADVHPVIAQNMYKITNERIKQIGLSWVKHGFAVAPGNICASSTLCEGGHKLGVDCSDAYSARLNGDQGNLGPRSEVNVYEGKFPAPEAPDPLPRPRPLASPKLGDGRLRVSFDDLMQDQAHPANAGARYFVEAQYVHPEDAKDAQNAPPAARGKRFNNVSYREVTIAPLQSGDFTLRLVGPTARRFPDPDATIRERSAIYAWRDLNPNVRLFELDVPADGRMVLGVLTTAGPNGSGFHTEIALYNLTSHRCARSLTVVTENGSIGATEFQGVSYSQEDYSSDDWKEAKEDAKVSWATGTDEKTANAVRWGTLYNFAFDSSAKPTKATIGLLRTQGQQAPEMNVPLTPDAQPNDLGFAGSAGWIDLARTERDAHLITAAAPGGAAPTATAVHITCALPKDFGHVVATNGKINIDESKVMDKIDADGHRVWTIYVEPAKDLPKGHFEDVLKIQTKDSHDAPFFVRVYGEKTGG